ncbi:hypothetical protein AMTRI_Chr13g83700 [Amborella trichopoda]
MTILIIPSQLWRCHPNDFLLRLIFYFRPSVPGCFIIPHLSGIFTFLNIFSYHSIYIMELYFHPHFFLTKAGCIFLCFFDKQCAFYERKKHVMGIFKKKKEKKLGVFFFVSLTNSVLFMKERSM